MDIKKGTINMAQTAIRNLDGMAVQFQTSQIVNIRATTENQLVQIFKSLNANADKAMALVQTKLSSEHRQISTLKAVMISPEYWDTLMATVGMDIIRQIKVHSITSDYLLTGDRFNRILPRLSPTQDRYAKLYEINNVGGVGQVDLMYPFVPATLDIVGAVPTLTFPSTGLLQFAVGDVGTPVDVSFVTQPMYSVAKVIRTHDQVDGHTGVVHPPYAYVMHPTLCPILGITIPII